MGCLNRMVTWPNGKGEMYLIGGVVGLTAGNNLFNEYSWFNERRQLV